jgi:hypothetical protein
MTEMEQEKARKFEHLRQMFRLFQELHDKSSALHAMACQATGEENSQINQQLESESFAIVSSAADAMGHIKGALEKDWP